MPVHFSFDSLSNQHLFENIYLNQNVGSSTLKYLIFILKLRVTFVATRPAESEQRIFRLSVIMMPCSFYKVSVTRENPLYRYMLTIKKHKLDLQHNHLLAV